MATIEQIIKNINRTLKDANIPKRMREDLERKKNILSNNKVVEK
jgi:uncharacterized protein (UPF0147 family)